MRICKKHKWPTVEKLYAVNKNMIGLEKGQPVNGATCHGITWSNIWCFYVNRVDTKATVFRVGHRVYRVPGFFSSRPNWVPPNPHPQGSVLLPPLGPRGGDTLGCGKGEPIPTKGQTTGRQLRTLFSVLYRIISKRRYILAAQLLLREKSGT